MEGEFRQTVDAAAVYILYSKTFCNAWIAMINVILERNVSCARNRNIIDCVEVNCGYIDVAVYDKR